MHPDVTNTALLLRSAIKVLVTDSDEAKNALRRDCKVLETVQECMAAFPPLGNTGCRCVFAWTPPTLSVA